MMHLYVSIFFYVADEKQENARKKTRFANHTSQVTDKPTVSQTSFHQNIERNPLQQLDISKFFCF